MQQSFQPTQQPAQYGLPMMNNAHMPMMLNTQQPQSRVKENYHVKCVKGLSITQIVLGLSAIIIQIWGIIIKSGLAQVGAGIWTGVFFIIAGSLGVVSSKTRTTCTITSFLVMSIIASVLTIGLLAPSAVSVAAGEEWSKWMVSMEENYQLFKDRDLTQINMTVAVGALLVFISVTEAIVAIVSSCFACHVLCSADAQQGTMLMQGQVQYIQGPNGQAQMVIVPMPNQANVSMANPPYQYTNPVGGFCYQPLSVPAGGPPPGLGMPTAPAQVHQPQTYFRQAMPTQYEQEEKRGEIM